MNWRKILRVIGQLMKLEAILMVLPLLVALSYRESDLVLPFLIPIVLLLGIGFALSLIKVKHKVTHSRDGLVIVGLSWIILSFFGCLPYLISKEIPSFSSAFFETVSGFTTTGASIINDVESLSKGLLFWRSFTNWIGGMGVLVLLVAIIPNNDAESIHIIGSESPGPQVGKLVAKMRVTSRILYSIYFIMTIILLISLLLTGMDVFDSIVNTFATAGTGGFSIKNLSIESYNNVPAEIVITIFMFLFGINFNVYYFLIIGYISRALRNEEVKWYLIIVITSILLITINLFSLYSDFTQALRFSSFQVVSIITTTGFSTTNFDLWPSFSKSILFLLMFSGACASSTCGGMKISRFMILVKSSLREIKKLLHPRRVSSLTLDKKVIDEGTIRNVGVFFFLYMLIILIGTLIVSIDGHDMITNITAVLSSVSNIGPGLSLVGPYGNYSIFSDISKLVLSFIMLAGRLELFPLLLLFFGRTYKSI